MTARRRFIESGLRTRACSKPTTVSSRHPPMEYIGRGGGTNRWELISWPIHLPATELRIMSAIAASDPPPRSNALTSVSSMANRQYRSFPSAVKRTRLQFRQNGRLTDAMKPTWPTPSVKRYTVAAGRGPELPPAARSHVRASPAHHRPAVHVRAPTSPARRAA
jgi:hypothetical protein